MTQRHVYLTVAAVLLIASVPAIILRWLYEYRYYQTQDLLERVAVDEAGGDRRALEELFRRLDEARLDPLERRFLFERLTRFEGRVRSIYGPGQPIAVELVSETCLPLEYEVEVDPTVLVGPIVLPRATRPFALSAAPIVTVPGGLIPGVGRDERLVANDPATLAPGHHPLRIALALAVRRKGFPKDAPPVFAWERRVEGRLRVVRVLPDGYPPILDSNRVGAVDPLLVRVAAATGEASGLLYPSLRLALASPIEHGVAHAVEVRDESGDLVRRYEWRVPSGETDDRLLSLVPTGLPAGRHRLRVTLTPSRKIGLADNARIETIWSRKVDEMLEVEVVARRDPSPGGS